MPALAQLDLDGAIDRQTAREDRAAEMIRRDRDHGGMRSIHVEAAEEDVRRAVAGWLAPYRAETSLAEVAAARRGDPVEDWRTVTVGRLAHDVHRAVARWSKLGAKDDRELLATDALLLLLSWPEHGSDPTPEHPEAGRIDLGGARALRMTPRNADRIRRQLRAAGDPRAAGIAALRYIAEVERVLEGTLPRRADWLDPEQRDRDGMPMCTRRAQYALRAAVKQALRQRYWRAELAQRDRELVTDDLDLLALIDQEDRDQGEQVSLPDGAAPEVVALLMELSLDGARALVAQHERLAHESGALREQWQLSAGAYAVAISRGKLAVRERWPDPVELIDALRDLPARYRALCERGAILALIDWRDGMTTEDRAADAVAEWRGATAPMRDADRALLAAARRAIRRAGGSYGSADAELLRELAPELIGAARAEKLRRDAPRQGAALAPSYPMPAAPRRKLADKRTARRAQLSAELRELLAAGSANADRIAELRAELRAGSTDGALALSSWSA